MRDVDFNPNKQYYLASCGDDCKVKFWDTRSPTEPVRTLEEHSHWYCRPRSPSRSERRRPAPSVLLGLIQSPSFIFSKETLIPDVSVIYKHRKEEKR